MNIWQIQQELLDTFNELEENGGELTPELEDKLNITQSEFKNKIENYLYVIKKTESDINACDAEAKRLTALKKSKQNTVDRIKSVMAKAIEQFGDKNKNGNKFIDLGTAKITVRTSNKVIVNDDFAENLVNSTFDEVRSMVFTKELQSNDLKDLLTIPENKLDGVTANISIDVPLKDLYKDDGDAFIKSIFAYGKYFKVKANISKTELKANLEDNPNAYPELAHLEQNKTLIIK